MRTECSTVQTTVISTVQWPLYCTSPKGGCTQFASFSRMLREPRKTLSGCHCPLQQSPHRVVFLIKVESLYKQLQCNDSAECHLQHFEFCSNSASQEQSNLSRYYYHFLCQHCPFWTFCRYRLAILASTSILCEQTTSIQHVFFHPSNGFRIGEAKNPGPEHDFLLKCCLLNPTAILNKVDIITELDCQIFQVAENSATAAIQLAAHNDFKQKGYQTHWSPPVAAHGGVAHEENSYRGQATGVSLHSLHPIRSSRVKLPSDVDHTRIISTITQIGTWKIHFVTVYGYPSCHQKSKERTNALVQAAAFMIDQVNLPAILSGDFNHPLDTLGAGNTLDRCGFVNLQKKYHELYSQDMPHTCREVTSPDQVLISSDLQRYITAIVVDKQKAFSDHDPVIFHLRLPIKPPMKSVWRLPQTWLTFQPDTDLFETHFVRLALQNNLPLTTDSQVELQPLPDALELWARVTESAVDATLREQHSKDPIAYPQKYLPTKCRGRVQPRKIKHKPYGDVIATSCHGQYDPPGEATSIHLKLVVRQTRRVQSLYYRMHKLALISSQLTDVQLQQLLQEWAAISKAKGFGTSFPHWCSNIPELFAYPIVLPSLSYLLDLSQFLKVRSDQLSYDLQQFRSAKSKFQRNNLDMSIERSRISKIVKGTQSPMVESLQETISSDILAVRSMQGLIEVDIPINTQFRMDAMITIGTTQCDPIEQSGQTITLVQRDADEQINPEQQISQTQWVSDPKLVAQSLNEYWNQYWNRDQSNPPDWSEFQQLLDNTPALPQIEIKVDDPNIWKQAAKQMKSRSARGVDGFLVDELKSLPNSAFQALSQIFARSPSQAFGNNLSQVVTLPLAKNADPSSPSQTRPITLVAILYRLWAKVTTMQVLQQWKDIIPDYIIGFLPGRSPEIEMIKQQYLFEIEHSSQTNPKVWQGVTLDLVKCFNLIGRYPAALALKKSGIPAHLVDTWYNTLQQQLRIWKVHNNLFLFDETSTGTPEGDSWSVLACIALSRIWAHHTVQTGAQASCYADNWSLKADNPQITEAAINITIHCANALKLLIDWAKTWCWRTSSIGKVEWKRRMQALLPQGIQIHIVSAARELGYTMAYNKVQSRQTQRQRHDDAIKRILRLRKTRTNLHVKAQICADACLSKALFATMTYHVGNPWIKELRSLIAKTLVPDRRNSNPYIACQMLSPFVRDPEVHLIIDSVRSVRRFLFSITPDEQKNFLYFASRHSGNYHAVFGPAGALRANLLRIGWQLDKHGWLLTDSQVQFHILQDNLPDIIRFLEHCWMKHVMQCRITRKDWQQFPTPNRVATTKLLRKLTHNQQQVLASQITGAYMLGHQRLHVEDAVEECSLCGQTEDIYHRVLNCPELQHIRTDHTQVVSFLSEHHPCHMYLPVEYQIEDYEFQTWFFQQLPDAELLPDVLDDALNEMDAGQRPTFWTDGSCNTPHNVSHRRAAYGIVYHPQICQQTIVNLVENFKIHNVVPSSFQVLGSAACQGAQTIPRAEMQAILTLMKHLDSAKIFTDSQYVIDQVARLGIMLDKFKFHHCPNFDLLSTLWDRLQVGDYILEKIKAHDLRPLTDHPHATFLKLGNEVADAVAKQARQRFETQCPCPPKTDKYPPDQFAKDNLEFRYQLQVERTKLLTIRQQINRPFVASKTFQDQLCPNLENYWSFQATSEDLQAAKSCLWGTQYAIQILRWLETLQWPEDANDSTVGISWYELACNFLVVSQTGLVINIGGTGKNFQPRRLCPTSSEVDFSRQVFSFERAITHIQAIIPRRILPMERTIATSVRLLGLPTGKSGLLRRPTMAYQSEMVSVLLQHFSRGEIPPEVPLLPIQRALIFVEIQQDDLEHELDWKLRIRVYNRERKKRR